MSEFGDMGRDALRTLQELIKDIEGRNEGLETERASILVRATDELDEGLFHDKKPTMSQVFDAMVGSHQAVSGQWMSCREQRDTARKNLGAARERIQELEGVERRYKTHQMWVDNCFDLLKDLVPHVEGEFLHAKLARALQASMDVPTAAKVMALDPVISSLLLDKEETQQSMQGAGRLDMLKSIQFRVAARMTELLKS